MSDTTIVCLNNGPLRISGNFVIKDAQEGEFDLSGRDAISLDETLTRVERRLIIQAMARAKGLHETAAKLLGIWRTRLGRRLKALKIEDTEWQRFVSPEADGDALPPDRSI